MVLTERDLLRQLGTGDRIAFELIYEQYWERLYRIAREKVLYPENAEEIVQDIFVDLWERRKGLAIHDLEHYLLRAVKYKVLDYVRAQIIRRQHENTVITLSEQFDSETEEELAYRELRDAFQTALGDLPEKTREIFRLSRIEQLSSREISDRLQIPERTVTYHLAQGLRTLRVHLKDFVVLALSCLLIR